jgi:two-component system, chemotaxis family, chemotaxis protein CheY
LKILIAEDEETIREFYTDGLGAKGHDVIMTFDGMECLNKYKSALGTFNDNYESPFDAVVLDYSMPVMDGLQAATEILHLRPNQRIIFASAHVEDTLRESVKKMHMIVELLQKPFKIQDLVDTLEDTTVFEQLSRLNVDIQRLKSWNPSHSQLKELLDGLTNLRAQQKNLRRIVSDA